MRHCFPVISILRFYTVVASVEFSHEYATLLATPNNETDWLGPNLFDLSHIDHIKSTMNRNPRAGGHPTAMASARSPGVSESTH